MRHALLVFLVLLLVAGVASAQTPYIGVFFNSGYSQQTKDCPGSIPDVLYVAGFNFNALVVGAGFAIEYPQAMTWLSDADLPPVAVGYTPTGLSVGWAAPQNGFSPIRICTVNIFWQCMSCPGFTDTMIRVIPDPTTGVLGFTDYPQYDLVAAVGTAAVICPVELPTEETTWGGVKALYE
jgi:hypothetical protein